MKLHTATLLFGLAVGLGIALIPVGLVYSCVRLCIERRGKAKAYVSQLLYTTALGIDQLGNVSCQHLFNWVLLRGEYYPFGNEDETISSVLGRNQKTGTLTRWGRLLANILDAIDEGHCQRAIGN